MADLALRSRFLAPGDRLGKFDLIRQVAVGGMAELYLARTMGIEGFEKLVVVKRILPQYAENQSFVNMFLNEARLSATLHHPNITQVYDIGVENGDYFFSMEYVHGEDLGRTIVTATENGVSILLDSALTLIVGLCAGLHYAHEKAGADGTPLDVVHRDVSPSNVLVSYEGGVKLVDFGIARAGSQPAQTKGGLKGKIAYMSPEQCRGKAVLDRRSDVFSIGTILYELTTGQLPFTDETEYGVLNQIVNTDAARPSTIMPTYPPALETIVMKALARDVEQRYATARELQSQLEDFAHENRLRVSPLVLARLMSTLFPARLEEWDHARAQGAFFVEQHVVRTLIESGKTSDNTNVAGQLAKRLATGPSPVIAIPPDEEPTAVTAMTPMDDLPDDAAPLEPESASPFFDGISAAAHSAGPPRTPTLAGPGPAAPTLIQTLAGAGPEAPPARQTAAAPARSHVPRAQTPIPGGVPITGAATPPKPIASAKPAPARSQRSAGGGVLVSNPSTAADSAPVMASPSIDVTERVRIPTPLPTRIDDVFGAKPKRSRVPLVIGALATVALGTALTLAMLGDSSSKETKTTAPAAAPGPETAESVAAEPVAAEPVVEPVPAQPVPAQPVVAEPVPARPALTVVRPVVAAKPVVVNRPRTQPKIKPTKKPPEIAAPPKSEPKPKKESAWNDDSPFMPVRIEKR